MTRKWLVVGAGLTGATIAERIASVLEEQVTLVERRAHLAGNAHDAVNEYGILVHTYGPHIFHTNSKLVWEYLSRFGSWRPYEHKVLAEIDGRQVPVPINLNSIDLLFSPTDAARLSTQLVARFGLGGRVPILKLLKEPAELGELGAFVYEKVFSGYTFKQWNLTPDQLAPSVTARVPVIVSRDDRYFDDTYQALPVNGYTELVERMLDHRKIEVNLNTEFNVIDAVGRFVIFTGPIDEFFDFRFGPLPYRTMRFQHETVDREWMLRVGTVNYPDVRVPFTRVTEMKRLTGQVARSSTLVYEYPGEHIPGRTEPHYPVPMEATRALYDRYRLLAGGSEGVLFCGRLGEYRYYNMDQAVAAALAVFQKSICGRDVGPRVQ